MKSPALQNKQVGVFQMALLSKNDGSEQEKKNGDIFSSLGFNH